MKLALLIFSLLALFRLCYGAPFIYPPVMRENTNRYYLTLRWDCPAWVTLYWGTNRGQYLWSNTIVGTEGRISNLLYEKTYYFKQATNCTDDPAPDLQFPPPQLPWTNYVNVGCTGQLQISGWLSGPWMNVTGRNFTLRKNQNVFFRSKARERLTVAMTNNQLDWSWAMHRQ